MKHHILLLSMTLLAASFSQGEKAAISHDDPLKPALEALEKEKHYLFKHERVLAEIEHGKEKADAYMVYFEKGMNSKTGLLMMHSHESIWLEVAHRRGFAYRQAFIRGYLSGLTTRNTTDPTQSH